MSMVYAVAGFAAGFLVGVGATLFYLRWKMGRQLGKMQEQMEDMMDLGDVMEEGLEDIEEGDFEDAEFEDLEEEEVEEADFEEKEE